MSGSHGTYQMQRASFLMVTVLEEKQLYLLLNEKTVCGEVTPKQRDYRGSFFTGHARRIECGGCSAWRGMPAIASFAPTEIYQLHPHPVPLFAAAVKPRTAPAAAALPVVFLSSARTASATRRAVSLRSASGTASISKCSVYFR
jgi:hypothetical protein